MPCDDASAAPSEGGNISSGIELPKRLFQPPLSLRWNEVLSLTPAGNQVVLWYRHPRTGFPTARRFGATDPLVAGLNDMWTEQQRRDLDAHGALEGCALPADSTPTWLMFLATVGGVGLICSALVAFARTASDLWPQIAELPGDASGWYLLTLAAYSTAGVVLTALLLVVLGRHLADRRAAKHLASWRIDRRGLLRRDDSGGWQLVGPRPDDRVDGAGLSFGGVRCRHSALSGQPLTRQLLAALSDELPQSPAGNGSLRGAALRLAVLWPPLLIGVGYLIVRVLGIESLRTLCLAAGAAIVLPVATGALLLVSETRRRREDARNRDDRRHLLDALR